MKKLLVLVSLLLVSVFVFSACSSGTKEPEKDTTTTTAAAAVQEASIDEEQAKAIALDNAGIKESAAEELSITDGEFEGKEVFVITFKWSGFDYKYSISKANGDILESVF